MTLGDLRAQLDDFDDGVSIVIVLPNGKLLQGESVEVVVTRDAANDVAIGILCSSLPAITQAEQPAEW